VFYGIRRGCSDEAVGGGALVPSDKSLLDTRNGTITQRITHYYANDENAENLEISSLESAAKINNLQNPILCYFCKSGWTRSLANRCVTPAELRIFFLRILI